MANIVKVYPSEEECRIITNISCPIKDCQRIFKTTSNLTFHMANVHEIKELKPQKCEFQKQFYCPTVDCYTIKNNKHFNTLRDLREHFLKVHVEKNVSCTKCKKAFSAVRFMKRHFDYCGIKFVCPTCKISYDSYETLKTHCRRKNHGCPEKKDYLGKKKTSTLLQKGKQFLKPQFHPILPKISRSYQVVFYKTEKCSQDSQTNTIVKAELVTRTTQVSNKILSPTKRTQETQTEKNLKISASTQTEVNAKPETLKRDFVETLELVPNQKTIDIQTDKIEICENSCNTSFKLEEFEFSTEIEKSSCSTQTIKNCDDFYSISTMTHDSIHTDTSDLLTEMSNFDANFFNCNMETQTDCMLSENELFDSDFYSNMYTQTCGDILSSFTDIETQTVVDDVLRSVESQTLMSKIGKIEASFNNMETQTDSEFREMLEIINS